MWCRPYRSVLPMYMPGRLRTAVRPSRTSMSAPVYAAVVAKSSPLASDCSSSSGSSNRSCGNATYMLRCSARGFHRQPGLGTLGVEDHARGDQAAGDIRVAEDGQGDADGGLQGVAE